MTTSNETSVDRPPLVLSELQRTSSSVLTLSSELPVYTSVTAATPGLGLIQTFPHPRLGRRAEAPSRGAQLLALATRGQPGAACEMMTISHCPGQWIVF